MQALHKALQELRELDQDLSLFGASLHKYNLADPLSIEAVETVENKYSCALPEDYKIFITNIGNGGAGPFYGLFPLEQHDLDHGMCAWDKGYIVGDLSKPFPHSKAWNLPRAFLDRTPDPDICVSEEQEEAFWEKWQEDINLTYWTSDIMEGAIPICHQGCAIRTWLAVTGPMKGTVWEDFRSEYNGIAPIKNTDGTHSTFTDWYSHWLITSLDDFKKR